MKQVVELWNETKIVAKRQPVVFSVMILVLLASIAAFGIWGLPLFLVVLFGGMFVFCLGVVIVAIIRNHGLPQSKDRTLLITILLLLLGILAFSIVYARAAYPWFLRW